VKIERLQDQCDALGAAAADHLTYNYFKEVDVPLQGDLVVYNGQKSLFHKSGRHLGIYQTSPLSHGTVLSKWTYISKKAFQTDLFAAPTTFGNTARFFRVIDAIKRFPLPPLLDSASLHYTIDEKGAFNYIETDEHNSIRKLLDSAPFDEVRAVHGSVIYLKHLNKFEGNCALYALRLALTSMPAIVPADPSAAFLFVKEHFIPTNTPANGDIAVYLDEQTGMAKHFGIYRSQYGIESKWGKDGVYLHPPFDVPKIYDDKMQCYKLNLESFVTESKH
jgi:hypothetical protein